jgi:hypothetical protein
MAKAASSLVDGRGAQRVLLALIGEAATRHDVRVRLRLADASDENWLLDLQRAPETRRHFRNAAAPTANEHRSWMMRTLNDADTLLLIVEADKMRAGMARLDRAVERIALPRYTISIAMCPSRYNQGIGSVTLSLVRRMLPGAVLDADIKPENVNSIRLFTASGFQPAGGDLYRSLPPAAASAFAPVRSTSWVQ